MYSSDDKLVEGSRQASHLPPYLICQCQRVPANVPSTSQPHHAKAGLHTDTVHNFNFIKWLTDHNPKCGPGNSKVLVLQQILFVFAIVIKDRNRQINSYIMDKNKLCWPVWEIPSDQSRYCNNRIPIHLKKNITKAMSMKLTKYNTMTNVGYSSLVYFFYHIIFLKYICHHNVTPHPSHLASNRVVWVGFLQPFASCHSLSLHMLSVLCICQYEAISQTQIARSFILHVIHSRPFKGNCTHEAHLHLKEAMTTIKDVKHRKKSISNHK